MLSPVTLALLDAYLTFQNSTSTQNTPLSKRPHIFPNPNHGWLTIQSPGNKVLAVELTDVLGRRIDYLRFSQEQISLPLSSQNQAHLWVKVYMEQGVWTELIYLE